MKSTNPAPTATNIAAEQFKGNLDLASYTIPNGVTSIGEGAFEGCKSLTSITIPDSVTHIGDRAFSGCKSLTSIIIPDGVYSIGDRTFFCCTNLTSITIPDSMAHIGDWAFSYCSNLTSITIPHGVTSIGHFAFSYCISLTSITIPNGVFSIGDEAFKDCYSLSSITISGSVYCLGLGAFTRCNALRFIVAPDKLLINRGMFGVLDSAEIVTLRDLNSYIANLELKGSYSLQQKSMIYKLLHANYHTQVQFVSIATFIATEDFKIIIRKLPNNRVPYGAHALFEYLGDRWGSEILKFMAFRDINSARLTAINIFPGQIRDTLHALNNPSEVKPKIIDYSNCVSLCSFNVPNDITSISENAFRGCINLKYITIPDSVTQVGKSAFRSCKKLTSITIPASVTSIGNYAFESCEALKLLVVPDNLSIDKYLLRINELTKIITHNDLNSFIAGLELKGRYSLQQQSMIYQLLHYHEIPKR